MPNATTPRGQRRQMLQNLHFDRDRGVFTEVVAPPIAPSSGDALGDAILRAADLAAPWGVSVAGSNVNQARVGRDRSPRPVTRLVSRPHTDYPSRYAIGEVVRFDPEGDRHGEGLAATVTAITFTNSKVFYDLRLAQRGGQDLQRVDSAYVWDAEEA